MAGITTTNEQGQLMISYKWEYKALVKRVYELLKPLPIKIWFDENEMHGSIYERMAEGVDGSSAVLVFYSKGYFTSDNCKREAEYAGGKKKKIIYVLCEANYKPDGWLGLMLGVNKYYDLSSEKSFKANIPQLIAEVKRVMGISESGSANSQATPQIRKVLSTDKYNEWTEEDVQEWLDQENLSVFKAGFNSKKVDGKLLVEKRRSQDNIKEYMAMILAEHRVDLAAAERFMSALRKLPYL